MPIKSKGGIMPYGRFRRAYKKSIDKVQNRKIAKLSRQIRQEQKFFHTLGSVNVIPAQNTNAVVLQTLTAVNNGNISTARVGDRISVSRIVFSLRAYIPQGASQANWLRVIIYQDNRYTGTDLTGLQILPQYNVTDTSDSNLYSDYNNTYVNTAVEKGKQVTILMDKKLYFGYFSTTATQAVSDRAVGVINFKKTYRREKIVNYTGNTQAGGVIVCAVFPGADTTAAQNPAYSWESCIYFTDC
jgi:hypothetical protein